MYKWNAKILGFSRDFLVEFWFFRIFLGILEGLGTLVQEIVITTISMF